ncbi:MAG: hypothetical protein AAF548_18355 [Actinomycetota bacterium]
MSLMQRRRRLVLGCLLMLGIIGLVLVFTASDDRPPLDDVVTEEGLVTEVPQGWERTEQFAFEFQPVGTGIAEVFDRWTVARACGPDGCDERSLGEWLEVAERLPTFVQASEPDSGLTITRDEFGSDYRVLGGVTAAETAIVFVAAFDDGRDFYVECGLALSQNGDPRLLEEIVDVCRATVPVGG